MRSSSAMTRGALTGLSRVGQPDVGEARVGEDFGFAELGAADARWRRDRSASARPADSCASWRAAASGCRAGRRPPACDRCSPAPAAAIDEDRRRRQIVQRHLDHHVTPRKHGNTEHEDTKTLTRSSRLRRSLRRSRDLTRAELAGIARRLSLCSCRVSYASVGARSRNDAGLDAIAGEDARGGLVVGAEVAHHDFAEDVAEVGGDREVAALVAVLGLQPRPLAVDLAALDAAADAASSRCRARDRCRGCRSPPRRGRTPTS